MYGFPCDVCSIADVTDFNEIDGGRWKLAAWQAAHLDTRFLVHFGLNHRDHAKNMVETCDNRQHSARY